MPLTIDWYALADLVWKGYTIPAACEELGHVWLDVSKVMGIERKRYLLDVSMVAGAREEYLSGNTI